VWLAFLNLGPSEVALILVLLVLLFGAERIPELARRVGQAKAQLDSAQKQIAETFQDEDEKALAAQLDFERKREAHMAAMGEPPPEELEARAAALGLQTQGIGREDLKAAIAAKLAGEDAAEAPLEEKEPEKAASAQQGHSPRQDAG
jgi:sec-independent protein translocase protein TatA